MRRSVETTLLLGAVLLLIAVPPLFARGEGETQEQQQQRQQPQNIDMWAYVPEDNPALDPYVNRFNDSQNQVQIDRRFIPFAEFKRQLTVAVSSGNPPDIALVDNPDYASFAEAGAFAPLDQRIRNWQWSGEDFYPGPWQSARWNDTQYGLPFETNTLVLFYNAEMFEAAGLDPDNPPETWEELTNYARQLTTEERYGISISAVASEEGTFQWLPFLQQNGGSIRDLDSDAAIEALNLWVNWIEQGYVSEEVVNFTQWAGVRPQFTNERAAMMINGPWVVGPMRNNVPDLEWRVATLPYSEQQASAMGGANLGLMADQNVDAGWQFVEWLYQPDRIAQFWNDFGSLPIIPEIGQEAEFWQGDPVFETFLAQMEYARPRGPHPQWPQISEAIYTAMQEALTGQASAEEALTEAANTVDDILGN